MYLPDYMCASVPKPSPTHGMGDEGARKQTTQANTTHMFTVCIYEFKKMTHMEHGVVHFSHEGGARKQVKWP